MKPKIIIRLFLIAVILMALVSGLMAWLTPKRDTQDTDTDSSSSSIAAQSFQSIRIDKNLQTRPDYRKEEVGFGNLKIYSFEGPLPDIYHRIYEKDGKRLFKTTELVTSSRTYPSLFALTYETHGDPEGKFFDRISGLDMYVYATQGIALVGSTTADEATSMHEFEPQSIEEFRRNLGEYLIQRSHE